MKLHAIFALLCLTGKVWATSLYIQPFSEFVSTSPNIVFGKTSNIRTEKGLSQNGKLTIYTFADFEIQESIKGALPSNRITIRKPGGTKDGLTLDIPSSPEFKNNEEVVLFLSEAKLDQSYEVAGMELGKFGVKKENGEAILTGGIFHFASNGKHDDHHHGNLLSHSNLEENRKAWSLTDLRELVKKQSPVSTTANPLAEPTSTPSQDPSLPASNQQVLPNANLSPSESNLDISTPIDRVKIPFLLGILLLFVALFLYLNSRKK